jgi:mannose-6-phosphate isomerase-like protein (cupin superfamily)
MNKSSGKMKKSVVRRTRDLHFLSTPIPRVVETTRRGVWWVGLIGVTLALVIPSVSLSQSSSGDELEGFVLWSSDRVEAAADRLEKELGDKALVWETIGNYEGHSVYLVLRGKTGLPEVHETESDVQISVRGKATSVVGGELVDPEVRPRKQLRGTAIKGGERQQLSPGDIMHIPPGVPHQLLIDPEDPYMYILIKIDEEPLQ